MNPSRATFHLVIVVLFWACAGAPPTPAVAARSSQVATSPTVPTLDEMLECRTPDVVLKPFPSSAPDDLRVLAVPEVLQSRLGFVQPLALGAAAPCKGIDPKYIVKPDGGGGVRWALMGKVVKPLSVWRAFSQGELECEGKPVKRATQYGSWWTTEDPRKSGKDAYQIGVAVCSLWNDFTSVVHCTIRPGAVVAVGPTQSVSDCKCPVLPRNAPESYQATDNWQVYLNLYGTKDTNAILACEAPIAW